MTTLAAVADELYALTPEEFTAARDAAAKRARDAGDRELADEVKQLRRPSVAAWLVNQLARSHAEELEELLELGESLRAATDALDGAELRTMTRQRRQVIATLSARAGQIASADDRTFADPAQREVAATLDAAIADEAAALAVRSGRLMRTLASTGLEAVDLSGAVAAPDDLPARHPSAPAKRTTRKQAAPKQAAPKRATKAGTTTAAKPTKPAKSGQSASKRQAAKAAERSVRAAERDLEAAEDAVAEQEAAIEVAREAAQAARKRAAAAEAELEAANRAGRDAEKHRRDSEQARRGAVRARDAARRALAVAQNRADRE